MARIHHESFFSSSSPTNICIIPIYCWFVISRLHHAINIRGVLFILCIPGISLIYAKWQSEYLGNMAMPSNAPRNWRQSKQTCLTIQAPYPNSCPIRYLFPTHVKYDMEILVEMCISGGGLVLTLWDDADEDFVKQEKMSLPKWMRWTPTTTVDRFTQNKLIEMKRVLMMVSGGLWYLFECCHKSHDINCKHHNFY